MRAILSVFDKTGLIDFARGLAEQGVDIYSTGGTKKALSEAGVKVHSISELTNFPEILDGRVKTLHPAVHGGILARRDVPDHLAQLAEHGIGQIDLVAVNLYPFVQTVSKPDVTMGEALENIDIGGPTMIRAAAKNFPHVLVVVDPSDYSTILERLRQGSVGLDIRQMLAQKAFQHVASYDTAIAQYLLPSDEIFPQEKTVAMKKLYNLRYGENPHQRAAFYAEQSWKKAPGASLVSATQLAGKELSFNNILDIDSALSVVSDFAAPTVAIIKHTNPCGLASHKDLAEAYRRALQGDPVSAFGGIVALNRPVDLATVREIVKTHFDSIIAPDYEPEALEILRAKKALQILATKSPVGPEDNKTLRIDYRRVRGGFLVQTADTLPDEGLTLRTVTKREPTTAELSDLLFAWQAVRHIKSNAIVLVKDRELLGMGAGQPNRVVSVELSLKRAGERARGSVLGSDAFFPFPDGVEMAGKGGVTAIIQPGGSVKDAETVKVADQFDIAMVFTGIRHFKH